MSALNVVTTLFWINGIICMVLFPFTIWLTLRYRNHRLVRARGGSIVICFTQGPLFLYLMASFFNRVVFKDNMSCIGFGFLSVLGLNVFVDVLALQVGKLRLYQIDC